MIQVSRDEAMEMRRVCGYSQVKNTWSHHKTKSYFLVENPRNLEALDKYRESKTVVIMTEKDI